MSGADQALKAEGINPKTKQPYTRGVYNTGKSGSAAAGISREGSNGATATAMTKETNSLKAQVKSLEQQVKVLTESQELAVRNATLEAQNGLAEKLLNNYIRGLQAGASLSAGNGLGSPAVPQS